jgi:hypothetical protein
MYYQTAHVSIITVGSEYRDGEHIIPLFDDIVFPRSFVNTSRIQHDGFWLEQSSMSFQFKKCKDKFVFTGTKSDSLNMARFLGNQPIE